jgi:hypothetical protein
MREELFWQFTSFSWGKKFLNLNLTGQAHHPAPDPFSQRSARLIGQCLILCPRVPPPHARCHHITGRVVGQRRDHATPPWCPGYKSPHHGVIFLISFPPLQRKRSLPQPRESHWWAPSLSHLRSRSSIRSSSWLVHTFWARSQSRTSTIDIRRWAPAAGESITHASPFRFFSCKPPYPSCGCFSSCRTLPRRRRPSGSLWPLRTPHQRW